MTTAYNAIPKFLANTSYKNPTKSAPFNLAYQTDMPVFKWREHNPENAKAGQAFMAAQRIGQRSVWDGQVPLEDFKMTQDDLDSGRILMCDVGGGSGHQCIDFRKHTLPNIMGKIITQDLGAMQELSNIRDELQKQNVTMMPHDFMTEQPVKGAKVYYLRNVIHK
jgi:demethylsterigmatocystin 6-O-methyltransferase